MTVSSHRVWMLAGLCLFAALGCAHQSRQSIGDEASRATIQAFVQAYQQEQRAALLQEARPCRLAYAEITMLEVPAGLRGAAYVESHRLPVFVEPSVLDCDTRR